ncbi:MAG TPA: bifunctional (p)ppGpp synthetase/guanosine-3',5'-bis(diphosphate) 3'-pyrophosphohydrolase [Gammaproteobacteria bacterium]|nr:bifunctional (p)ppGpp synthetase/guanosine-3',5'-bis(diphosphate) 3'-pyrophosphohydrolase [Gammaproteobacteria bacterium]
MQDLLARARVYLKPRQLESLIRAYEFGARAHDGQRRASGEPYIHHPIAVAIILADMHMDHETLVAAMLHDVIEDTGVDKAVINREFGPQVAEIVDGLSKLTQVEFESHVEQQARNFQKMLMAMSSDLRVIVVKLADRLHNMRTLRALPPKKRRAIAHETLDIYAPIAQRLGMNQIRLELEDLGFAALHPMRYRVLSSEVRKIRGHRKEIVQQIKAALKRRLRQEKIACEVLGREKHLYSIYQKMRTRTQTFSEVYDVYAFRILVDTVDVCYRVLGTVHNLYKPVPNKFKDYIAIPKANGYQSLHTVLFGPYGVPIEVQIRTHAMNEVAEAGIAAHWLYKSSAGEKVANSAQQRAREWLRGMMEIQRQAGNSEEFLEHIKTDLFPDEVYVFTPKGDILELPKGATAVDFAYAVHTDLGNTCVGARVNRVLMPLRTPLATGQTVEIITAPGAHPNPTWLNFAVTGKARSHIRHYFKNLRADEARTLGRRLLNRELEAFHLNLDTVDKTLLKNLLEETKLKSMDALLEEIGLAKRMAPIVVRTLIPQAQAETAGAPAAGHDATTPLVIKGTEGMVVSFPKCCLPIPGDEILGYVTAGRGIVIHRQTCKNIAEFRNQPEKWIDVDWADDIGRDFLSEIRLTVTNQRGALATIAGAIADQGANIENIQMSDLDDRYVGMTFLISVRDRVHLARVLRAVRRLKHITRVQRTHG